MIVDQDQEAPWVKTKEAFVGVDGSLVHHVLSAYCPNMAAEFALAVVQETLERLDSYQDGERIYASI